ncbi:DUF1674 domain-containing protein [Luteimonas viscosa]|uniref:DUF1674 domain-containing protein n=1 Tax=Luteimonas viscosa TaxID=1132694 RepID=UPI0021CCFC95|nr:DUF1674 domain-containing protein [Luteimonas viscosa]
MGAGTKLSLVKHHDILGEQGAGPDPAGMESPVAVVVPGTRPGSSKMDPTAGEERLDPTRYGDWEKNGRCIDF